MNQDMSILTLVLHASFVVQVVMAGLLLVSLASWTVIFGKLFGLARVRRLNDEFEREFWSGANLNDLHQFMNLDTMSGSSANSPGHAERIQGSEPCDERKNGQCGTTLAQQAPPQTLCCHLRVVVADRDTQGRGQPPAIERG